MNLLLNIAKTTKTKLLILLSIVLGCVLLWLFLGQERHPVVLSQYHACEVDADCVVVTTDCEDCSFDAINREDLAPFRIEKNLYCKENPPQAMCDAVAEGEAKCVSGVCSLVK
jgi:hypothetical protein